MSRPSSTKLLRGSPREWSSPQPKCPSLAQQQGSGPDAAVGRASRTHRATLVRRMKFRFALEIATPLPATSTSAGSLEHVDAPCRAHVLEDLRPDRHADLAEVGLVCLLYTS